MPRIIILCPHCSFSRELNESAIPPGVVAATCPKCHQKFMLSEAISPVPPPEPEILITQSNASIGPSEKNTDLLPSSSTGTLSQRKIKFDFTGTSGEYFGIWIVNTLLKILTLGVYSAWAKVRKRRYFYGSTSLGGASFDYLADPKILFRGWVVAALFFMVYSISGKTAPQMSGLLWIAFFIGMPWLVVRSRTFNLRNSDHRNIRFTFNPDYRESFVVFAGIPILLPFTLGLIFPYMIYRQKKFLVENSGYGRTRFAFDASASEFYTLFLKGVGWFILLVAALVAFISLFSATLSEFMPLFRDINEIGNISNKFSINAIIAIMVITFISFILLYLYFVIYIRTSLSNLTWNATRLRKSRFISTLRVRDMAWLYLSSAVVIVFSFGLMTPWATIRITRYRMNHLALDLCDDIDGFLGWGHPGMGPAGEEIGDMFGIDIGL